jgi:hypothetical protein
MLGPRGGFNSDFHDDDFEVKARMRSSLNRSQDAMGDPRHSTDPFLERDEEEEARRDGEQSIASLLGDEDSQEFESSAPTILIDSPRSLPTRREYESPGLGKRFGELTDFHATPGPLAERHGRAESEGFHPFVQSYRTGGNPLKATGNIFSQGLGDIREFGEGLSALMAYGIDSAIAYPKAGLRFLQDPGKDTARELFVDLPAGNLQFAKDMVVGAVQDYAEYFQDPIGKFRRDPLFVVLDIGGLVAFGSGTLAKMATRGVVKASALNLARSSKVLSSLGTFDRALAAITPVGMQGQKAIGAVKTLTKISDFSDDWLRPLGVKGGRGPGKAPSGYLKKGASQLGNVAHRTSGGRFRNMGEFAQHLVKAGTDSDKALVKMSGAAIGVPIIKMTDMLASYNTSMAAATKLLDSSEAVNKMMDGTYKQAMDMLGELEGHEKLAFLPVLEGDKIPWTVSEEFHKAIDYWQNNVQKEFQGFLVKTGVMDGELLEAASWKVMAQALRKTKDVAIKDLTTAEKKYVGRTTIAKARVKERKRAKAAGESKINPNKGIVEVPEEALPNMAETINRLVSDDVDARGRPIGNAESRKLLEEAAEEIAKEDGLWDAVTVLTALGIAPDHLKRPAELTKVALKRGRLIAGGADKETIRALAPEGRIITRPEYFGILLETQLKQRGLFNSFTRRLTGKDLDELLAATIRDDKGRGKGIKADATVGIDETGKSAKPGFLKHREGKGAFHERRQGRIADDPNSLDAAAFHLLYERAKFIQRMDLVNTLTEQFAFKAVIVEAGESAKGTVSDASRIRVSGGPRKKFLDNHAKMREDGRIEWTSEHTMHEGMDEIFDMTPNQIEDFLNEGIEYQGAHYRLKIWNPTQMKVAKQLDMDALEAVNAAVRTGETFEKGYVEAIGRVMTGDVGKLMGKEPIYFMPEPVWEQIRAMTGAKVGDSVSRMGHGLIDRPLDFFRWAWLATPRFLVNTTATNILMSITAGMTHPQDYIRAMMPKYRIMLDPIKELKASRQQANAHNLVLTEGPSENVWSNLINITRQDGIFKAMGASPKEFMGVAGRVLIGKTFSTAATEVDNFYRRVGFHYQARTSTRDFRLNQMRKAARAGDDALLTKLEATPNQELLFDFKTSQAYKGNLSSLELAAKAMGDMTAEELGTFADNIDDAQTMEVARAGRRGADDLDVSPGTPFNEAVRAEMPGAEEVGGIARRNLEQSGGDLAAEASAYNSRLLEGMVRQRELMIQGGIMNDMVDRIDLVKGNPELFHEAIGFVNNWFFDYFKLHPIERKVVRKIIPFWNWTKNINALAAKMPFAHPGKTMLLTHIGEVAYDVTDQEELPPWLRGSVRSQAAKGQRVRGGGLNPFQDIADPSKMSRHPLLDYYMVWATGAGTFPRGRRYTDRNVITKYNRKFRVDINSGQVLDEIDAIVPSIPEYFARSLPALNAYAEMVRNLNENTAMPGMQPIQRWLRAHMLGTKPSIRETRDGILLLPSSEWKKTMQYSGFSTGANLSADQMEQVIELQSGTLLDELLRQQERQMEDYGTTEEPLFQEYGILPR